MRSTSFVFTADVNSVADMQQIEVVKKSVKAINDRARSIHKFACARALYRNEPMPKKPTLFRVRLMGRGPRVQAALNDYGRRRSYDAYLPQRYAQRFDVYISEQL